MGLSWWNGLQDRGVARIFKRGFYINIVQPRPLCDHALLLKVAVSKKATITGFLTILAQKYKKNKGGDQG